MNRKDIPEIAKTHSIKREVASPDFFEGAVMGNGNLGVVVCTRPDAIVLYLGHNDIWDIRIEEGHKNSIGTFKEIWKKILDTPGDVHNAQWYNDYVKAVTSSYSQYVYPRPYPASAVYFFFDRKEYEVTGHTLDISNGLLTVNIQDSSGKNCFVKVVLSMQKDAVYVRTEDSDGKPANIFYRMKIAPHTPDNGLPDYKTLENGFIQLLPYNGYEGVPRPEIDKGFSVLYKTDGKAKISGTDIEINDLSEAEILVTEGFYTDVEKVTDTDGLSFDDVRKNTEKVWTDYWMKSGIKTDDFFLDHIWYTNTYFLRCVLSENSRCPGLFGNWMYGNIGTAWHGDYHMNYNTQQPFWGLMAANRQELHMPYLRMVENFMPVSTSWARDFYNLDGACFPHSAYPVPMTVIPYPSPDWGWEILETPWTVQSLWWHYTYTGDVELLKNRLFPLIKAATAFLAGYMTREGSNPVKDDKYHLFPTIVPEKYGLSEGFKYNLDGAVDLTLTKFVFNAYIEAVNILKLDSEEKSLAETVEKILSAFPEYPVARSKWGDVYVSVANEDPDNVIYNCPANIMQIFPGEDIDERQGSEKEIEIAKNSWLHHYNEGGNDLVFYHLIGARLGLIDIEKFKRHVRYCLMRNETASDRVTLTGGRYSFNIDFDFMSRMGIWVENFSLHAVVAECLIRGHRDVIELFPNWDKNKPAQFCSFRTKGAFLVDAECKDGTVSYVRITAEKGGKARIRNPWSSAKDENGNIYSAEVITVLLNKGETVSLKQG
ncbi:MAG: hypothetical protein II149_05455 [Clostridia bacterium]|nr:hypothetical protein [Clostridia bacterium]